MSRPFSYNDENFTVIGNIVFFHIKITKAFKKNENIIEVPQAIYERMCNKSNNTQLTTSIDGDSTYTWFSSVIEKSLSDGKYYYSSNDRDISDVYVGFYAVSWYFLKDI